MNPQDLEKFRLKIPNSAIVGTDRERAAMSAHMLRLIESQFFRAVAAFAAFEPISDHAVANYLQRHPSEYEQYLNIIYGEAFVYAMNTIRLILKKLKEEYEPPESAVQAISEFQGRFSEFDFLRDSAMHFEDRGRWLNKSGETINTDWLLLGAIRGNKFVYTGNDSKPHYAEISERVVSVAHKLLQSVVNSYTWWSAG